MYKIVSFINNDEEFRKYSQELNNIIAITQKSKTIKEEIIKESQIKDRTLKLSNKEKSINKDPFKVLLETVNNNHNSNQLPESKKKADLKSQEKANSNPNLIFNKVELIGILNNQLRQVVIVKFGDSDSSIKIMKVGDQFAGLTIREIEDKRVLIEGNGKYHVYTLGGERN
jgi:hypothetical protein